MYKLMYNKKIFNLLSIILISILTLSGCTNGVEETDKQVGEDSPAIFEIEDKDDQEKGESIEESAEYLKEFFDVSFEGVLTKEDVNSALEKVFGEEATLIEGELNGLTFIKAINEASGFKELALTYSNDKAIETLEENEIDQEVEGDLSRHLASIIDSGLLDIKIIKDLVSSDTITHDMAIKTFAQAVNNSTLGRNYIGYSDESDIYRKIEDAWDSFVLFDDKELTDAGAKLIKDEKITGYNLKSNSYIPDFLPEKTMIYGHSNIDHALQLIGLLNSEGLVAKVQLEPKISIYKYLPEWGDPGEATAKYFVDEVGDLMLANAVEYDLSLEFSLADDLFEFEEIVDKYAKKNEENKGEGLIVESWWQPFLLVANEETLGEDFMKIYTINLSKDDYTLRTAVLEEDKDEIENEFKKLIEDIAVKTEEKYTNKAFYDYLQGINYQ